MTAVPGYPPPTRNIQVFVDSVALLGGAPPAQCVFLCDDADGSDGRGSTTLATQVVAGQFVSWHLIPIDLQAPAWIAGIDFGDPEGTRGGEGSGFAGPAWACRWEGYVPPYLMPGQVYPYRILLTFADGSGDPVPIGGMSLTIGDPHLPRPAEPANSTIMDFPEPPTGPGSSAAGGAPQAPPDEGTIWRGVGALRDSRDIL